LIAKTETNDTVTQMNNIDKNMSIAFISDIIFLFLVIK